MKQTTTLLLAFTTLVVSACVAELDDETTQAATTGSGSGSGSGSAGSGSAGSGSGSGSGDNLPADDEAGVQTLYSVPDGAMLVEWSKTGGTIPIDQLRGKTIIDIPGQPIRIVATSALASEALASADFEQQSCAAFTSSMPTPLPWASVPLVARPPSTWRGIDQGGGCGVLSTFQCDVRLGRRSPGSLNESTWNEIADELQMTPDGATYTKQISAYYRRRGYCADHDRVVSLRKMCKKFREGADVKATMKIKLPDGTTDGHIVTVVDCDVFGILVNNNGNLQRIKREGGKVTMPDTAVNGVPVEVTVTDAYIYEPCPPKAGR